jgi:hypothetical protein
MYSYSTWEEQDQVFRPTGPIRLEIDMAGPPRLRPPREYILCIWTRRVYIMYMK